MPNRRPSPLDGVLYHYTTIQEVRDLGIDAPTTPPLPGQMPDADIQKAILLASSRINQVTEQFFQPVVGTYAVSGTGIDFINTPGLDKIIELTGVAGISGEADNNTSSFSPSAYELDSGGRLVFRRSELSLSRYNVQDQILGIGDRGSDWRGETVVSAGTRDPSVITDQVMESLEQRPLPVWVEGSNNYGLIGAFGWLDPELNKLTLTLTGPIVKGATEIHVESTVGVAAGDSLVSVMNGHFIVNEVVDSHVLLIDPAYELTPATLDPATISAIYMSPAWYMGIGLNQFMSDSPSGSPMTLYRYGRVSPLISRVAAEMVGLNYRYSPLDPNYQAMMIAGLVVSEKTDGYQYKLATGGAGYGAGGMNISDVSSSGNIRWDRVLREFVAPIGGGGWV